MITGFRRYMFNFRRSKTGIMVGVLGVEPRTSSLSGTRSNQLSYTPGYGIPVLRA